jgi:GDP-D-mannose 3',5'-epimerase
MAKKVLVLGGGGFIGGHMVKRLVSKGFWVRSVDLKEHEYGANPAEFIKGDLCDPIFVSRIFQLSSDEVFSEVFQFAADMGGAGYIFTGENDAHVMYNSAIINLNVLNEIHERNRLLNVNRTKVFYSSSACIYPEEIQKNPKNPGLRETDAYPANPDSEYGWEKLFSERLFLAFQRNFKIPVRIARFHNIFGPEGTWSGGKEKSPAAICRKVAEAGNPGTVEIWGDGEQTRSFLFVEECLNAVERLMESDFSGPVNIGSEEMVSINQMAQIVADIAGKDISLMHVDGPLGVRGRNSNNELVRKQLGWDYSMKLKDGLELTYKWISDQLSTSKGM